MCHLTSHPERLPRRVRPVASFLAALTSTRTTGTGPVATPIAGGRTRGNGRASRVPRSHSSVDFRRLIERAESVGVARGGRAARDHPSRRERSDPTPRGTRALPTRVPDRAPVLGLRPASGSRTIRTNTCRSCVDLADASPSRGDWSAAREVASGRTRRDPGSGCDVRACLRPTRSYLPQGRRPEDLLSQRPPLEHGAQTCPHGRRHRREISASVPPRPTERSADDDAEETQPNSDAAPASAAFTSGLK